jgi:hypothetical protein
MKLWPTLDESFCELLDAWGENQAARVLRIQVFCTEKDPKARAQLEAAISGTRLYKSGGIQFCRPDIKTMLFQHCKELKRRDVLDGLKVPTHTTVVYCGSPALGDSALASVELTNLACKLTGSKQHVLHFEQENYGKYRRLVANGAPPSHTPPFLPPRNQGRTKANLQINAKCKVP